MADTGGLQSRTVTAAGSGQELAVVKGGGVASESPAGTMAGMRNAETQKPVATVLTKLDKWGDYEPCARSCVAPTRFLPMKTPLSQALLDNWEQPQPPSHPWTIARLIASQEAAGRRVGLLLDLSNHDTLYREDLPLAPSLVYKHIQLVAKMLPSRETVRQVIQAAKAFWAQHPDDHIAIHCAYGFNRTGFIIAAYLCEAENLTVDAALDSFAAARPPGVKHAEFIEELYLRYHQDGPDAAATAAAGLPPAGADPAEPVMTLQLAAKAAPPDVPEDTKHLHHAAIGNSFELTTVPPDSPPSSSIAETDGVRSTDSVQTRCSMPSAAAGTVTSLAGRTRDWLRRGDKHQASAAGAASQTAAQGASPFSAPAQQTPAAFRLAAWAARVRDAPEGDEDNESLQADSLCGSGQLRPSQSLSGILWHNSPNAQSPSLSFRQRLAHGAPDEDVQPNGSFAAGPAADQDFTSQQVLLHNGKGAQSTVPSSSPAADDAAGGESLGGSSGSASHLAAQVTADQTPQQRGAAVGTTSSRNTQELRQQQGRRSKRRPCVVM